MIDIKALTQAVKETGGTLLLCTILSAFVTGISAAAYFIVIAIWGEEAHDSAVFVSVVWAVIALLVAGMIAVNYNRYKNR